MVVKPDVPMELGNGPIAVVGSDAPSMTAMAPKTSRDPPVIRADSAAPR